MMFYDPDRTMLVPAKPSFSLPWRWIFAAGLIFVMALVASI